MTIDHDSIIAKAQQVLTLEANAIRDLGDKLDHNFSKACDTLFHCSGHVIIMGMGKSGHIGGKIAATLASTGTPSFFVHPAEANHGDLGMITQNDVVVALSTSGETDEVLSLLPSLSKNKVPLIVITSKPESRLAINADIVINTYATSEACSLNLAPTTSTTTCLALGDALAVTLLDMRGFNEEDFARSHPKGKLGKRLLLCVKDAMREGDKIPMVTPDTLLPEALSEMNSKGLGMTMISADKSLQGIYTDGDLRRTLNKIVDFKTTRIDDIMTRDCHRIEADILLVDALSIMEKHRVTALPVVDTNNHIVGALHMHDVLLTGIV